MSNTSYLYRLGAKVQDLQASMGASFSAKYSTDLAALNSKKERLMQKSQQLSNAQTTSHNEDYLTAVTGENAVANAMYAAKNSDFEDLFAAGGSDAVSVGIQIADKETTLVDLLTTKESEIIADIHAFATETGTVAQFETSFDSLFVVA